MPPLSVMSSLSVLQSRGNRVWVDTVQGQGLGVVELTKPSVLESSTGLIESDSIFGSFTSVDTDATGQHVVVSTITQVFISEDFGATYTISNLYANYIDDIAIASNATQYVVLSAYGGIYVSKNGGYNFDSVTQDSTYWSSVAISYNGNISYVVSNSNNKIYCSHMNDLQSFTPLLNSPVQYYQGIATSALGDIVYAVSFNGFYVSTNNGSTWTTSTAMSTNGLSVTGRNVATSANGQYIAVVSTSQYVLVSNNFGKSWKSVSGMANGSPIAVSMSSSGQYLNLILSSMEVYSSNNHGVSFFPTTSGSQAFSAVTTSGNGLIVAAVCAQGHIFRSLNSGVTWTPPFYDWVDIASSKNGSYRIAVSGYTFQDLVYMTSNGGETWTQVELPNHQWTAVACDSTCEHMVITSMYLGYMYFSNNFGSSWSLVVLPIGANSVLQDAALSGSGQYIAICVNNGYIFTSEDYGQTFTQRDSSGVSNCWSISSSESGEDVYAISDYYSYHGGSTQSKYVGSFFNCSVGNFFSMFVQVHMCLCQRISVNLGSRPQLQWNTIGHLSLPMLVAKLSLLLLDMEDHCISHIMAVNLGPRQFLKQIGSPLHRPAMGR
jgi:photosystem II stability/assembly factor-like uncharacterized protein